MQTLKYWLYRLGIWLWFRYDDNKIYIVFCHNKCNTEQVQLADFRGSGGEFQCFECNALVPAEDISIRVLNREEVKSITKQKYHYIFPHIVKT